MILLIIALTNTTHSLGQTTADMAVLNYKIDTGIRLHPGLVRKATHGQIEKDIVAWVYNHFDTASGARQNFANTDLTLPTNRLHHFAKHEMIFDSVLFITAYDTAENLLLNLGKGTTGMIVADGYGTTAKLQSSPTNPISFLNVNQTGFSLSNISNVLASNIATGLNNVYLRRSGLNVIIDDSGSKKLGIGNINDTVKINSASANGYNLPVGTPAATSFVTALANGNWSYFTALVPTIIAKKRTVGATGAVSLAAYTVGATDSTFTVSANVNITTSTTFSFGVQCVYTDETGTVRTSLLSFNHQSAGISNSPIANAGGAIPYEGTPLHIRAQAGTTITISTTGTFTTVVYNIEERIIAE